MHFQEISLNAGIFFLFLGDTDKLVELLLEGYDHILDIVDEDEQSIVQVVEGQNQPATVAFLQSILAFEVSKNVFSILDEWSKLVGR